MDEEKLADLLASLPQEIRDLVAKYLPAIQTMAADEIFALAEQVIAGKTLEAPRTLAARLHNDELLSELDGLLDELDNANAANAASVTAQKEIATKVMLGLVTFGLTLVAKQVPF